DNASSRADDLSRSPALQRAFLTNDRATIAAIARKNPGAAFYLHGPRVAGPTPRDGITRSTSLAFANGVTVGRVVETLPLGGKLAKRLLGSTTHAHADRLLITRNGVALGSGERVRVAGRTVRLGKTSYRGTSAPIPNAPGTHLLALRPERAISASVAPYEHRILYAAIGSFGLLLLAGLLFGGPILRSLGARYGGGGFAVIVPEADREGGLQLAERLRSALEAHHIDLPGGKPRAVTASFGVAIKGDLTRAEELIAAADEALYESKRAG